MRFFPLSFFELLEHTFYGGAATNLPLRHFRTFLREKGAEHLLQVLEELHGIRMHNSKPFDR